MVLVAVVVIGILSEAAYLSTSRMLKADREAELLFRGQALRRAIESYYKANKVFPRSLEDLLKDPHSPSRKHVRRLFADPVSRKDKGEWILVRAPDGGISGVASAENEQPLKMVDFPRELEKFNGAKRYSDWVFEYVPAGAVKPSGPSPRPEKSPP